MRTRVRRPVHWGVSEASDEAEAEAEVSAFKLGDRVLVKSASLDASYYGAAGTITHVGYRRWGGTVETDCSVTFKPGLTLPFSFTELEYADIATTGPASRVPDSNDNMESPK